MRRTAQLRRLQTGLKSDLGPAIAPLLARSDYVAGYQPVGTEPGVTPAPGWLLPILLPDGDLDWAVNTGEYVENHLGLREPAGPRLGTDAIARCDLVLVPALAVDRRGYRLGRGGGSYDRALRRATGFTVALLHDGELVDEVPTEPHDVAVDAVATPSLGVVRLPARPRGQ
jgi:5-formyltetrahydrofolate cyclo-ligase